MFRYWDFELELKNGLFIDCLKIISNLMPGRLMVFAIELNHGHVKSLALNPCVTRQREFRPFSPRTKTVSFRYLP